MKKKAARPTGSKKAPQKPVRKSVKKTAPKSPKTSTKKQAAKKKSARKIKAPVVVLQQIEALQEAGPLDDALVADGPAVLEMRTEEPKIEGPGLEEPASIAARSTIEEPAVHEAISVETSVIAMSADIVSKGVPSAELASDVKEDLRFGREFMMKYRETFKALAK